MLIKPTAIKNIIYIAFITLALLLGIVLYTPVAFTACSPHSWWCNIAWFFTSSGGPIGFFVLLVITGLFYASSAHTFKQGTEVFLKSIISLALFFGVLAFVNERYTKPILKSQRPSHVYMLNQTGLGKTIDSLYQLDKEQRGRFFAALVRNNPLKFREIDPDIQAHWVEEAGFSFPSGHTYNAFLFAMILSYAIYFNRSRPQWRKLFFIPFVWALAVAVSRVAVGAHTAFDVGAGAALGIATGLLFLYFDITRYWLTRKFKR